MRYFMLVIVGIFLITTISAFNFETSEDLGFTGGAELYFTDTNAQTICSGAESLLGNGTCQEITGGAGNSSWNESWADSKYIQNDTDKGYVYEGRFNIESADEEWYVEEHDGDTHFHFDYLGGSNYLGFSTTGAYMQLYANPNPSNDYLMWTVTETQGADTEINIYEGGTTHNRLWVSGSTRIGGGADYLCTNLTSDVDCDTPSTGADLVVQDDIWSGGKLFSQDTNKINLTSDANGLQIYANPSQTADIVNIYDSDGNSYYQMQDDGKVVFSGDQYVFSMANHTRNNAVNLGSGTTISCDGFCTGMTIAPGFHHNSDSRQTYGMRFDPSIEPNINTGVSYDPTAHYNFFLRGSTDSNFDGAINIWTHLDMFDPILNNGSESIAQLKGIDIKDLTAGAKNYGVRAGITAGTDKWFLYEYGGADNFLEGNLGIGVGAETPEYPLHVEGSSYVNGNLSVVGPFMFLGEYQNPDASFPLNLWMNDDESNTNIGGFLSVGNGTYNYFGGQSYADTGWMGNFFAADRHRGTYESPTVVQNNNNIFTFDAKGYNGTDLARAGQLLGVVDGTPAEYVPGQWKFRVTNGSGTLNDAMTLRASGYLGISTTSPSYPLHVNMETAGGDSAYFVGDIHADDYIEFSPYLDDVTGLEAIDAIANISGDGLGNLNHSTMIDEANKVVLMPIYQEELINVTREERVKWDYDCVNVTKQQGYNILPMPEGDDYNELCDESCDYYEDYIVQECTRTPIMENVTWQEVNQTIIGYENQTGTSLGQYLSLLTIGQQEYIDTAKPVDIGNNDTALEGEVASFNEYATNTHYDTATMDKIKATKDYVDGMSFAEVTDVTLDSGRLSEFVINQWNLRGRTGSYNIEKASHYGVAGTILLAWEVTNLEEDIQNRDDCILNSNSFAEVKTCYQGLQ